MRFDQYGFHQRLCVDVVSDTLKSIGQALLTKSNVRSVGLVPTLAHGNTRLVRRSFNPRNIALVGRHNMDRTHNPRTSRRT